MIDLTPPAESLDRDTVFQMLSDDGTFSTCLHIIALKTYGAEIYDLDPIELFTRLEEDFGARITQDNENKMNAVLMATATDAFYEHPEAFRGICETFADGDPGLDVMDELTVAEITWGVYEANLNHGDDELSPGVQALIAASMQAEALDQDEEGSDDASSNVWAYLDERWQELASQLERLGIPRTDMPAIR
jgi:hypothetical protein